MTLAADTYGASLLAALGVDVVLAAGEDRYPEMDLVEAAAAEPDLVLAPSEPYPFAARHVPELESVAPVVLVDGQDLFWWGARTPMAFDRLARALAR
jgi:ABC-type Fe3+-hydroxamate transport system substrate-binding protein